MPSWGQYKSALVMDEEWAQRRLKLEAAGVISAPSENPDMTPLGWSPELGYLTLIADRLELLRNVLIQVNSKEGSSAPTFKPLPRPKTAVDRLREAQQLSELLAIEQEILGGPPPS